MNIDSSEQREKMVDGQVRTTDVTDAGVLSAMLAIPREAFVPAERASLAYIDEDILISGDRLEGARYLMEPSPFAKLVQLAEIRPADHVLDVGAGSGYSTAVLSRLARSVVALESDPELADRAETALAGIGCDNVVVVRGPLSVGQPARAPFDVIVVGGCVEKISDELLGQLAEGGRLVVVEGTGNAGVARLYLKSKGVVTGRRAFNAAVKPLPGFEREVTFSF